MRRVGSRAVMLNSRAEARACPCESRMCFMLWILKCPGIMWSECWLNIRPICLSLLGFLGSCYPMTEFMLCLRKQYCLYTFLLDDVTCKCFFLALHYGIQKRSWQYYKISRRHMSHVSSTRVVFFSLQNVCALRGVALWPTSLLQTQKPWSSRLSRRRWSP